MNPQFILLILALTAIAIGLFAKARRSRVAAGLYFANIAEGTHVGGLSKRADAAITTRHLCVKIGSDADHVALAGTADIAIGITDDEAAAAEDPVNVNRFSDGSSTRLAVASAAIAHGAFVVTAASGKIRTLPATTGTYYIIGRALNAAAADGDLVEIDPIPNVQRVVT